MSDIIIVGDFEDRKLKRKIKESSIEDNDSEFLLTLSLGGNNMARESSSKFTFKSLKAHEEPSFAPEPVENLNNINEVIEPKKQQFSCNFCDKKFPNSQALGGHQNAHRRERILSKMKKEFAMNTIGLGSHLCSYSAMENHLPFHGPPLYHGAHMHPMAHMSTMPWSRFGLGYGNQGLYNTAFSRDSFGMMSNCWGMSVQAPQGLNLKDVGFGCELGQVPTLTGQAINRSTIARDDLEGLQGKHYAWNQQFSSSGPNLSLSL